MKSIRKMTIAFRMTLLEIMRNRISLVSLLILPSVMYYIVLLGFTNEDIPFEIRENNIRYVMIFSERDIWSVYISLSIVAFLMAFTGFYLMFSAKKTDYRLCRCGYKPWELLIPKILAVVVLVTLLSVYMLVFQWVVFNPKNTPAFLLSLITIGINYGVWGAIVASLVRSELEGSYIVFFLVLLDIGYLQIPFMSGILDKWYIMLLPAYFPARLAEQSALLSLWSLSPLQLILWISYSISMFVIFILIYMALIRSKKL